MADDDLDAFFDDVENAVKEVQVTAEDQNVEASAVAAANAMRGETHEPKSEEERPAKRTRIAAASSVPVRAVVASSVPVISIAPPLPAGPPPPASSPAVANSAVATSASSFGNAIPPPPPPPNSDYLNSQSQSITGQNPPLPPSFDDGGKVHVRSAAGTTWTDPTLSQWPANDFRLFVGNLAKDLKQHHLEQHFQKYPSFAMARIMYNKTDGKSRGYGFVSVLDAKDCARAIREMDQSWLGSRPIKVKLSEWKDREWKEVKKRGKVQKRKKKHFGL